jgi:hypothetical protein
MARKRGKEIGLSTGEMNKAVKSTAIFAILPSVPVLASYIILVPFLGNYFPWMRLSVVGSVTYETMVASMASGAFGFPEIYNTDFPPTVFLSILLILTVGILGGNFFNLFFLKAYDKGIKNVVSKNAALLPIITGALFIALYAVLAAPTLVNFKNPVGIATFIVAGAISLLFDKLAKKHPKLGEYAFSLSLLGGMISARIFAAIMK